MVKPRENRVPIMMSDDELQAIDDWRFNNRISTRSDAVRKLAKIGMITDEWIIDAGRTIDAALDTFLDKVAQFADLHPEKKKDIEAIAQAINLAWIEVMKVTHAAHELRTHGDTKEAIAAAERVLQWGIEERILIFEERLKSEEDDKK